MLGLINDQHPSPALSSLICSSRSSGRASLGEDSAAYILTVCILFVCLAPFTERTFTVKSLGVSATCPFTFLIEMFSEGIPS